MKDKVSSTDHVEADLPTEAAAPEYACPTCGKPMKDANSKETRLEGRNLRICSNRLCRTLADWASGTPSLIN